MVRICKIKGQVLFFSIVVMIILVILGTAFFGFSLNNSLAIEKHRKISQAFCNAEAGIEKALYDLRQDFIITSSPGIPSWSDGKINEYLIGPDTTNFYTIPYANTSLNEGSFTVELKNVPNQEREIWIRSTGIVASVQQTILVYAVIRDYSMWDNAIFGGIGGSGAMINGNVEVRGSVHILGDNLTSTDFAMDMGGTAFCGNNYSGLPAALLSKIPPIVNADGIETLNAEIRVKHGKVGLSGTSTIGQPDIPANSLKEMFDGSFVTDGYAGTAGSSNVFSDNDASSGYDLGDLISMPMLSNPSPIDPSLTIQEHLRQHALVLTNELNNIKPDSLFSYSDSNGSIEMDGAGHMAISGIIYVDGNNNLLMNKQGTDKTISYTGRGSILVTGNATINVNLVTAGDNSYPGNIIGIMTPKNITFNEANIDIMGLCYAENRINVAKQTNIFGTLVSNYFDLGTNVPSVIQVPATAKNLPPGMIDTGPVWIMRVISWQRQ